MLSTFPCSCHNADISTTTTFDINQIWSNVYNEIKSHQLFSPAELQGQLSIHMQPYATTLARSVISNPRDDNRVFRFVSIKTPLHRTALLWGNPLVKWTADSTQRTSNAESVPISWRHGVDCQCPDNYSSPPEKSHFSRLDTFYLAKSWSMILYANIWRVSWGLFH